MNKNNHLLLVGGKEQQKGVGAPAGGRGRAKRSHLPGGGVEDNMEKITGLKPCPFCGAKMAGGTEG